MSTPAIRPHTNHSIGGAGGRTSWAGPAAQREAPARPSRSAAVLLCALTILGFGWQSAVAGAAGSTTAGGSSDSASTSPSSSTSSPSPSGSAASSTTTSSTDASGSVSPAQAQINATEARVASLETQISKQQSSLDQADEQYNEAVVNLTSTRSSLQTTSSSIAVIKTKLDSERTHLRDDAIEAYIGDTSSQAVAQIFAAPNDQSQISDLYQQIGAGNVARDVAEVQANQAALSDTRSKLLAEQQAETAQATQEDKARQSAAAADAASEATLPRSRAPWPSRSHNRQRPRPLLPPNRHLRPARPLLPRPRPPRPPKRPMWPAR